MTAQDPALTRALEDLTMQVNADNIMDAHKVFRESADELQRCLADFKLRSVVGLCGRDPVSAPAAASFNSKITELTVIHKAHQEELDVAAQHLKAIALRYGHTEQEIADSLDPRSR